MSAAGMILDGKATAAEIREEVKAGVAELVAAGGRQPGLAVVLVGDNPASKVYVASKTRACEEVGMLGRTVRLPATATAAELEAAVDALNADDAIDGFLVQLPLPDGLPERAILERIDPDKDADGFHPVNVGRLWTGEPGFVPATPSGILELLRRHRVELKGAHAVVVGRSNIVGKPMAALLLREHCTVTVCHSRTRDLPAVCAEADLLVAAIGRAAMIGPEHVREGAVVIDVGMNRVSDRDEVERLYPGDAGRLAAFANKGSILVGDVDFTHVRPKAAAITPVPGGVGPLTVAMLLVNALEASRRRQGPGGGRGGAGASASPASEWAPAGDPPRRAHRRPRQRQVDGRRLVSGRRLPGRRRRPAGGRPLPARRAGGGGGARAVRPRGAHPRRRRRPRGGREAGLRRSGGAAPAGGGDPPAGPPAIPRDRDEAATEPVVVLEATLLVEAGYGDDFDLVVTVEADPETRLARAVARGM